MESTPLYASQQVGNNSANTADSAAVLARRDFLEGAAATGASIIANRILGGGLAAGLASASLAGCAGQPGRAGGYVAGWQPPEGLERFDRLTIAFALPTAEGSVKAPQFSPELPQRLGQVSAGRELLLSVGGYSFDSSARGHQTMLRNWQAALETPGSFVAASLDAIERTADTIGVDPALIGLDVDFEYPTPAQTDQFSDLMRRYRDALPNNLLTVAVPVGAAQASYDVETIGELADGVNLMAYDRAGVWSRVSGHIAPPDLTIDDVTILADRVEAHKIWAGYPGHGRIFFDTDGPGQQFTATDIIPQRVIPYQADMPAGEATIDGDWVSYTPAEQVRQTQAKLLGRLGIAGGFVWTAAEAGDDLVAALRGSS